MSTEERVTSDSGGGDTLVGSDRIGSRFAQLREAQ